ARGAREADATIATLLSRVHGPRRFLARRFLRRVRALAGVREAPKFHVIQVFANGRAILAPVGAALADAGRISAADDIWFLTLPDARRAVAGEDMHARVRASRRVPPRGTAASYSARALVGRNGRRGRVRITGDGRRDPRDAGIPGHGPRCRARDAVACWRATRARRGAGRSGDGSRLDSALPHRERAGDGDGRDDVPRRRRRTRV